MIGAESVQELERQIAETCGTINAAMGRLVGLIGSVLATHAYEGWGIRSPEQWVAWKCGVSAGRARKLVAMARRLPELPETARAFADGQLAEDQVAVIVRHTPADADASVAEFARYATVSQLSRVLRDYVWLDSEANPEPKEEARQVSFGYRDDGNWRLSAHLPADEAALLERATESARQSLSDAGEVAEPTWADALVAMADRSLCGRARAQRDRHLLLIHLQGDGSEPSAHLHLGPALPDALRRYLGCDGRVRAVADVGGVTVNVGRARRVVPARTRIAVEERDRGCRVPGCDRTRWLQVHHVRHWEDGGPTNTANLVCLCSVHHRQHHLGNVGVEGNADTPDGLVFTDRHGRQLTGCGRPAPPPHPAIIGDWVSATGERVDRRWIQFAQIAAQ